MKRRHKYIENETRKASRKYKSEREGKEKLRQRLDLIWQENKLGP